MIAYALLDKLPHSTIPSKQTNGSDIPYTPLNSEKFPTDQDHASLTWREKLAALNTNIVLLLSFFVCFVTKTLSLNGVVTTLAFSNSPFEPHDHYNFYVMAAMLGECIGRSYLCFVALCKPDIGTLTKQTWVYAIIMSSIFVFLCCEAWYRFFSSVWIVLVLMFLNGFLAGVAFVDTYSAAGQDQDSLRKEFSRALLPSAMAAGMLTAGVLGLILEPALRQHCMVTAAVPKYCFTRDGTKSCHRKI